MRIAGLTLLLVAIVVFVVVTAGPPPPTATPPGSFSFGVFGDAPYYAWEAIQYPIVLRSIDQHDLTSVIHVGDIFWKPCSDAMYEKSLTRFNSLRHPVIYTPGDNEWFDCGREQSGGYQREERLQHLRQVFFATPDRSLGRRRIPLSYQKGTVENARWEQNGVSFVTVHVIGKLSRERMETAAAWLREAFAAATSRSSTAVVIAFQANPRIEAPRDHRYRQSFEPFLSTLEGEAQRFGKPVLVLHGDGHKYIVDHPLPLRNVTRVQVPGSPLVGWVRVTVTPGSASPFAFDEYVVPRWKYW